MRPGQHPGLPSDHLPRDRGIADVDQSIQEPLIGTNPSVQPAPKARLAIGLARHPYGRSHPLEQLVILGAESIQITHPDQEMLVQSEEGQLRASHASEHLLAGGIDLEPDVVDKLVRSPRNGEAQACERWFDLEHRHRRIEILLQQRQQLDERRARAGPLRKEL